MKNLELQKKIFTDLGINYQDGLKLFDNIYAKELNKFVNTYITSSNFIWQYFNKKCC